MKKKELSEPPEELSNLIMREKKLKQKNLVDQINFNRDIRINNNEEMIKLHPKIILN